MTIVRDANRKEAALAKRLPWMAAMDVINGRGVAYVCRNFTCEAPITDPAVLDAALEPLSSPRRIIA